MTIPAWQKLINKLSGQSVSDDFVLEQVYRGLPEDRTLFREFCYVPGENFQVYIRQDALKDAHEHALSGLKSGKEVAGALIGRHLIDRERNVEFVEILDTVQAQASESTSVDVNIPANEWGRIQSLVEESTKYRAKWSIVGWYHSHPRMRAFMSAVDKSTQLNHFNHNGQVAIVLGIGNGISEVKCFDHFSNEVSLYFFPQENENKLTKANLEFRENSKFAFFSPKNVVPTQNNISTLDKVLDRIFRNCDLESNITLMGFDNPKGHIHGFDRLYPELRLGIEYYMGLKDDDAAVLRLFENDFMFFAINVSELDTKKIIDIIQTMHSSIIEYTRDSDSFSKELYRDILNEFNIILNQLRN